MKTFVCLIIKDWEEQVMNGVESDLICKVCWEEEADLNYF